MKWKLQSQAFLIWLFQSFFLWELSTKMSANSVRKSVIWWYYVKLKVFLNCSAILAFHCTKWRVYHERLFLQPSCAFETVWHLIIQLFCARYSQSSTPSLQTLAVTGSLSVQCPHGLTTIWLSSLNSAKFSGELHLYLAQYSQVRLTTTANCFINNFN